MVDTNCPWSAEEAIEMSKTISQYDILWLEEHINPPEDFDGLRNVRQQTGVSIAAGENACTFFQFKNMIEKNAIDYAQPSVTKVGGITEFLKIISCNKCKFVELYTIDDDERERRIKSGNIFLWSMMIIGFVIPISVVLLFVI